MDTTQIVTIDKKGDIVLGKDKSTGAFYIWFKVRNDKVDLPSLIDTALFDMFASLNPDTVESVKITESRSRDDLDVLYVLKRFGADLGIPQKCMHLRTTLQRGPGKVTASGRAIPYSSSPNQSLSPIKDCLSETVFTWDDPHEMQVTYMFQGTVHERLPAYMANIMGLLMKKLFLRVKEFIEKM